MYKNLRQVIYAGIVSLLDLEWTNYQTKRARIIGNKKSAKRPFGSEPPEGEHKDLADSRAASIYFATKHSAFAKLAHGGLLFWSPAIDSQLQGGNVQPLMPRLFG